MNRIVCVFLGFIAIASSPRMSPGEARAGSARLVAKMMLLNGGSRTIAIEGVGCSEAICSRVAVRSRADDHSPVTRTWLDTIAAIQDITPKDALFVLKDGTARRLSVVHDNRFLYFADQRGAERKIDMADIKSIEFLAPGQ